MAVDSRGNAHLTHIRDGVGGTVNMGGNWYYYWLDDVRYTSNETGSWESEIVNSYAYSDYAVAIDHSNNFHLSFYSWDIYPGGPLTQGIAYMTNSPAGVWQPAEAIEQNWSGGQMEGMFTGITIDHLNRPHVSYVSGQGNPQEDIRYAYKDSTTWNYTLVAPGTFSSRQNLITLDSGEFPHLFYIDVPSEELQLATNASGNWVIETFDPGPWYWSEFGFEFDRNNNMHVFIGKDEEIEYYLKSIQIDTDHDGLVDEEEHGPNGNDPNYDGNGDGITDSQQGNVASLHSEAGDQYVTIEAPDSTVLAYTRNISKPASGDPNAPPDPYCPYGFFQFTLFGIDAGRWVDVNIYLHGGPAIETYYKYGSTPDSTTNHWYQFDYIQPTGAIIHGDTVTLHLWDGMRGDDDLSGNGIIVEPGGPTLFIPSGLQSPDSPIPAEFALYQNYPNPFNPSTVIRYALPRMSDVEITIYNILGQKVYGTVFKNQPSGTYNFSWDGRNFQKQAVASGMYIYQWKAGKFFCTRKMLLLR